MDKDRIKGEFDKTKGAIEKGAGKATGDKELERKGAIDKAKGGVEEAVGKAKDKIRDATDDATD